MKTADERIADLESMVTAILPIALLGAHGTAEGNLHSVLLAMAANQDIPEGAREVLSRIAGEFDGHSKSPVSQRDLAQGLPIHPQIEPTSFWHGASSASEPAVARGFPIDQFQSTQKQGGHL